jgi:head-tail adaptor
MNFPDYATIESRSITQNAFGEDLIGWQAAGAGRCLVRPLSAEVLARQGRDVNSAMVAIYFPERRSLTNQHRIRVGSRTFLVQSCTDFNSMGRLTRVDCTEVLT